MDQLPISLESLLHGYESYLAQATRLGESTQTTYLEQVRRFLLSMGAQDLKEIIPQTLLEWQEGLRNAGQRAATLNQKHAALKSFFRYLEEFLEDTHAGLLLKMLDRMSIPKDTDAGRQAYTISEETLQKLLAFYDDDWGTAVRNRAIVHFLWATGVRRAEMIGVRLQDVNLEGRVALVTGKGEKTRPVFFDEPCLEALERWLEVRERWARCDNLFVTLQGRPLSPQSVFNILDEAVKGCGLKDLWMHLFRHTTITRLLDGGMSIQDVAVFAGHSSVNTTMKYFHKDPEELKGEYDLATQRKG